MRTFIFSAHEGARLMKANLEHDHYQAGAACSPQEDPKHQWQAVTVGYSSCCWAFYQHGSPKAAWLSVVHLLFLVTAKLQPNSPSENFPCSSAATPLLVVTPSRSQWCCCSLWCRTALSCALTRDARWPTCASTSYTPCLTAMKRGKASAWGCRRCFTLGSAY